MTIQGAHTLDLAVALLGPFADAIALATAQYPRIVVGKDKVPQDRTTADHILVQAKLAAGVPITVEVAGGRPPGDTPFRLEVTGEKGGLVLDGGAARGFQSGRLRLRVDGQTQPVDEGEVGPMPDGAANVAGVYAGLRDDIARGTHTVPDFDHAVRLSQLIEDLMSSSRDGIRKSAAGWPTA